MADVREFKVTEGGKKPNCPYCGTAEHPHPLMCPRIRIVWLGDDGVDGIEFFEEYEFPDDAA